MEYFKEKKANKYYVCITKRTDDNFRNICFWNYNKMTV